MNPSGDGRSIFHKMNRWSIGKRGPGSPRVVAEYGLDPEMMKRTMIVAAAILTLGTARAGTNSLSATLASIMVPEVDFRSMAMSDALEFLALCSVPVGQPTPQILQEVARSNVTYRITWTGKQEESDAILGAGPSITFKAVRIPLLDLFKKVTDLAAGTIEIADKTLLIRTKRVQPPAQEGSAADPF